MTNKNERMIFRLTTEEKKTLEEKAKLLGMTVSELIRSNISEPSIKRLREKKPTTVQSDEKAIIGKQNQKTLV